MRTLVGLVRQLPEVDVGAEGLATRRRSGKGAVRHVRCERPRLLVLEEVAGPERRVRRLRVSALRLVEAEGQVEHRRAGLRAAGGGLLGGRILSGWHALPRRAARAPRVETGPRPRAPGCG